MENYKQEKKFDKTIQFSNFTLHSTKESLEFLEWGLNSGLRSFTIDDWRKEMSAPKWLAGLKGKKVLECSDIIGISDDDWDDRREIEYERKALRHPQMIECEKRGWLMRHFVAVRHPSVYWTITDAGRNAIDSA